MPTAHHLTTSDTSLAASPTASTAFHSSSALTTLQLDICSHIISNNSSNSTLLADRMDPNQIMETLKSSFLFSFRTGNIVFDTLLTGIIIMLSTHFLSIANNMASWDIRSLLTWVTQKKVNKIVITGK